MGNISFSDFGLDFADDWARVVRQRYNAVKWRARQRLSRSHYKAHFNFARVFVLSVLTVCFTAYYFARARNYRSFVARDSFWQFVVQALPVTSAFVLLVEVVRPFLRESKEERYLSASSNKSGGGSSAGSKLYGAQRASTNAPRAYVPYNPVLSHSLQMSAAQRALRGSTPSPQRAASDAQYSASPARNGARASANITSSAAPKNGVLNSVFRWATERGQGTDPNQSFGARQASPFVTPEKKNYFQDISPIVPVSNNLGGKFGDAAATAKQQYQYQAHQNHHHHYQQ